MIHCKDCKWWYDNLSECRRRTPWPRGIKSVAYKYQGEGMWVTTEPNDWCGEAEPKEEK